MMCMHASFISQSVGVHICSERIRKKNKNESLKDNYITQWLVSTSLPFSIDKNLHVLRKGTRLIF